MAHTITNISGINSARARELLNKIGVGDRLTLVETRLGERVVQALYKELTDERRKGNIDDSLKDRIIANIAAKKAAKTREGERHLRKLPLKGRTKTNANTRKRVNV